MILLLRIKRLDVLEHSLLSLFARVDEKSKERRRLVDILHLCIRELV